VSGVEHLRELMRRLRDPRAGCPWDREQTFATIVPHTIEEAYELAAAIESGDHRAVVGELGDLLFQVIFYCQLGAEAGSFDFEQVTALLADKLVQRHPHVFGDLAPGAVADVHRRWEAHKAAERRAAGAASELDDVPVALPALTRAAKLQKRAARVGFDWPDSDGVWAKLDEEVAEARAAEAGGDAAALDDELGDLLFTAVNVARRLGRDPETVLRAANAKFERRFRALEWAAAARGVELDGCDAATLDALWSAVKAGAD